MGKRGASLVDVGWPGTGDGRYLTDGGTCTITSIPSGRIGRCNCIDSLTYTGSSISSSRDGGYCIVPSTTRLTVP